MKFEYKDPEYPSGLNEDDSWNRYIIKASNKIEALDMLRKMGVNYKIGKQNLPNLEIWYEAFNNNLINHVEENLSKFKG